MYKEQCGEDACWCSGLKGLSQKGQARKMHEGMGEKELPQESCFSRFT